MGRNSGRFLGKMFAVIITAAAAAAVILSAAGCAGSLKKIRIGTAGIGGNYNSFGNAYAQLLMGDYKGVDVEVKVTAGSGENLKLITKEPPEIDLAIMQADVISEMQKTDGNTSGFKAVAGMYTEAVQIVVRKDSGITDVSDLHGKKIGIGASGSGTEKNAMLILKVYGVVNGDYEAVNLSYARASQALQEGVIDAFFCTMGTPTTVISSISRNTPVDLLQVDGEAAEKLTSAYSYYVPVTIPAGTYTGQDKDVHTIGVKSVLVASEKLGKDAVKKITQSLFTHAKELQYAVSVDYEPDPAAAVKDLPIELHEGAKEWYRENGIEISG